MQRFRNVEVGTPLRDSDTVAIAQHWLPLYFTPLQAEGIEQLDNMLYGNDRDETTAAFDPVMGEGSLQRRSMRLVSMRGCTYCISMIMTEILIWLCSAELKTRMDTDAPRSSSLLWTTSGSLSCYQLDAGRVFEGLFPALQALLFDCPMRTRQQSSHLKTEPRRFFRFAKIVFVGVVLCLLQDDCCANDNDVMAVIFGEGVAVHLALGRAVCTVCSTPSPSVPTLVLFSSTLVNSNMTTSRFRSRSSAGFPQLGH